MELSLHKRNLEALIQEQADILRHSNDVMVDALSSLIEYRSVESGQHILRIRHFTRILMEEIAKSCPEYRLDAKTVDIVASASALHDIGKIAIPDSILNKPGRLTEEERELMKTHALTGSKIMEELDGMGNEEYLRYAHNICHYHHERWDGNGYPEGLKGDSIPICAQVVGLADAYDALTNKRVYKEAFSHEKAVNMILQGDCGVFSPKLLECFKIVGGDMYELAKKYADGHSPKNDTITIPLPEPERQDSMDTLQAFQAKYHTILHYIDGTVVEMDVESGVYHLVYNPYPELADLATTASFEAGIKTLIRKNIPKESQGKVLRDFFEKIRVFMEESLRKQAFTYRMYSPSLGRECEYEVVFLRLRGVDSVQKRMIMIWRRLDHGKKAMVQVKEEYPEWIGLEGVVKCRIDRWLTMEGDNSSLAKLLGYTEEELRIRFQNSLIELMAPEEQGTILSRLREQLRVGRDVELECRMIHKDGRPVWMLNKARLVIGQDGKEYLWGKLVDVTKTHYRQGVLQQELERLKIILSQVDHVIFDWDILEDQMVHSDRWLAMFGYEPIRENFSERVKYSHLHPEDIKGFQDCLADLKRGEPYREIKLRLAKADGRYLWCSFRATTQFNAEGVPVRAIGVVLNIDDTERATH
ncbi:MAG: PAS domain-containing protein, partial [Lentisphaeria bacterium]|nr:PAS domain-containing protein [Lentisphaeria bacterium]